MYSTVGFPAQMGRPVHTLHNHGQLDHHNHPFYIPGYGLDSQQNYDALYSSSSSFNLQPTPVATDSSRSYTVIFSHDEEQCVIKRMINMHMISDSEIKELSPSHVQLLNTMFANKKKRLDCFNDMIKGKVKHGSKLLSLQKSDPR